MRKSWGRVDGDVGGKTKVMVTLPPNKGWVPNHPLYNLSPKHDPRVYLSLPCVEALFLLAGLHYIDVHYDYLFIQHILKSLSLLIYLFFFFTWFFDHFFAYPLNLFPLVSFFDLPISWIVEVQLSLPPCDFPVFQTNIYPRYELFFPYMLSRLLF